MRTPKPYHLDLSDPQQAYLFGFIQTDGTLSSRGNKGRISVEIQEGDSHILHDFQRIVTVYSSLTTRVRDTNFKEAYRSVVWSVCDWGFRQELTRLGVPAGRKSDQVAPPVVPHSEVNYWRGVIDGDGSLGLTATETPFISLVTKSKAMAEAFTALAKGLTGKSRTIKANQRDNIYNVSYFSEAAVKIIAFLYYDGALCLNRKRAKADQALAWQRPAGSRAVTWATAKWTPEEDAIVLSVPIAEAIARLGRSRSSITIRKSRLRGANY